MIKLKKISILFTIIVMTSVSFNTAYAERDCSNPKGFHAKMACKLQKDSSSGETNGIKKERGAIGNFLKKIKDFGGKNVGSEG